MQNEYGDTALLQACGEGHVMIAALLIENGALVNYQNKVKSTVAKMWWLVYAHKSLAWLSKMQKLMFQQSVL